MLPDTVLKHAVAHVHCVRLIACTVYCATV